MKDKITLFENGKDIEAGDKFVASVDSVEGHRRVTLTKVDEINFRPLAKALAKEMYGQEDFVQDEDFTQAGIDRKESERDAYD